LTIHYERAGNGPPLLLLHGIGSNSRSFRHQLTGLSDGCTVIAWDAPGYGKSSDPRAPFSMADLADAAAGLLDELHIARAHILGVSMGGVVAQLVYHRHPERVASLMLCDTTASRSQRAQQRIEAIDTLTPRQLAEQRAPQLVRGDAPATLVNELIDVMAEVRPAGYRHAALALGDVDLTGLLPRITVPTLVIHGEDDGVVPLHVGEELARAIPGAELVVIRKAGHVSNQEQPQAFNEAVRKFLRAQRPL
jgi:pimeloyl-ACP methyl ester carboxylesterase